MKRIFEATPVLTDQQDIDKIVAQVNKKPSEKSMAYANLCIDVLHNIYERTDRDENK